MDGESPTDGVDHDALVALALSRPHEALRRSRALLAATPDPRAKSYAHQAIGLVLRQFGDVDSAVGQLRLALSFARASGDPDRQADVSGTLGLALALAGRPREGLRVLDTAVAASRGVTAGRVLVRRAHVHWLLSRHDETLRDARDAVGLLRGRGMLWEARAISHRAMAYLALGDVARADRDYATCELLFGACGQLGDLAFARYERGLVALARGDLPTALALFEDARARYDDLGVFEPDLAVSACAALLAAGLYADAVHEAEQGLARIEAQHGTRTGRAELLFTAGLAALAAGDPHTARERGEAALRLFRQQQRPWLAARAELLLLRCDRAAGTEPGTVLLRRARRAAVRLQGLDPAGAVEAHLVVGALAIRAGRRSAAREHLGLAAAARRGPGVATPVQSQGWLAQALLASMDDDGRAVLRACDRGLRVLELYLTTLGATELRTSATARGTELANLALRRLVRHGSARQVLAWTERWRAVVLTAPPVRPDPSGPVLEELAALRELTRRMAAVPPVSRSGHAIGREQRRLERAVRRHALASTAIPGGRSAGLDVGRLLDTLDGVQLVELVEVDREIHAVVVGHGRVRRVAVGPAAAAERSVEHARFLLRREGSGRGTRRLDIAPIARQVQEDLLGPAVALLDEPEAVIVPTGRLHAVPWGMLPFARDRVVTVAPSAASWLRAIGGTPPQDRRVLLVGGPDLSTGVQEVQSLAELYPDAVVLHSGTATSDRVVAAMDGAWLVHIAAHGTFRADGPLFSAIHLDDGPLTVYDLERLARAPHRVILPSCESAIGAPTGADELLGVVSALVARGCAGLVASVVPVDDPSTVPLMLALHEGLRSGAHVGQALHAAQTGIDDPRLRATAQSFVAFGR